MNEGEEEQGQPRQMNKAMWEVLLHKEEVLHSDLPIQSSLKEYHHMSKEYV